MYKIVTMAPEQSVGNLINAMAQAGAGTIGAYTHCAYITHGTGNWYSGEGSHPTLGEVGKMSQESEEKIEMLVPDDKVDTVVQAIYKTHPYETPEIDIYQLVPTPARHIP